jgi:hypothetical protein
VLLICVSKISFILQLSEVSRAFLGLSRLRVRYFTCLLHARRFRIQLLRFFIVYTITLFRRATGFLVRKTRICFVCYNSRAVSGRVPIGVSSHSSAFAVQ